MKTKPITVKADCKLAGDFEILRRSPIFADADIDVIRLFAYLARRKKYQPGDQIITIGREAIEAFYLISGSAEVITLHHHKEVMLQQLNSKTFFGELALLASFPWFVHVRALTECEAITITRESFIKVLDKFPAARGGLVEKIVQLRVQRLVAQTHFILESIPDALLSRPGASHSNVSI